ncbi:unnamed protein product, partial [Meganyctiphanes norvegica]
VSLNKAESTSAITYPQEAKLHLRGNITSPDSVNIVKKLTCSELGGECLPPGGSCCGSVYNDNSGYGRGCPPTYVCCVGRDAKLEWMYSLIDLLTGGCTTIPDTSPPPPNKTTV